MYKQNLNTAGAFNKYRQKQQEKHDQQIITAAYEATILASVATLYDLTDFFFQPDTETPTDEALEEIQKIVDSFGVDRKRRTQLMERITQTINHNRMNLSEYLKNVEKLMVSIERGSDDWVKLNKAINENLDVQIIRVKE